MDYIRFRLTLLFLAGLLAAGGSVQAQSRAATQQRADRFLELVNAGFQSLYRVESEAQWLASTDVNPVHDAASETAGKARAAFVGNPALIREAKALLERRSQLKPLTVLELER